MNSTGDDLHPNWRALATIHLPLKRFIKQGDMTATKDVEKFGKDKYEIKTDGDGRKVKEFYEELVNEKSNVNLKDLKQSPNRNVVQNTVKKKHGNKTTFDKNKFFRCAVENKSIELESFELIDDNINAKDDFGWTALMMAACEGATSSAKVLLSLGASKEIKDKKGKTAIDFAKMKGHDEIVSLLQNYQPPCKRNVNSIKSNEICKILPFFCDICQCRFSETSLDVHQTSTIHKFNAKSSMSSNKLERFNISHKNRGLQMMVKQGWDKESGLGPTQNGRLYPIKTVIRKQRTGLGIEQQPPRVTHFDAFDMRATQNHYSDYYKKKQRNRNDIKREKVRDWKIEKRLRQALS